MAEHALKNLRISIFIRVLPIFVPRILGTRHTTTMDNDVELDSDLEKINVSIESE